MFLDIKNVSQIQHIYDAVAGDSFRIIFEDPVSKIL